MDERRTFDQFAAVGRAAVDLQGYNVALCLIEELDGDSDRGCHGGRRVVMWWGFFGGGLDVGQFRGRSRRKLVKARLRLRWD